MLYIIEVVFTFGIALASSVCYAEGGAMLFYALSFEGRPYVAHTLETDGEERLVMNLNEVDCTTYVEYALALMLADGDTLRARDCLQRIRYRDGCIDGYASRLHYVTEWIASGVRNGFFDDVSDVCCEDTMRVYLNFMSSHPQAYKHLRKSPENVEKMRRVERRLSTGKAVRYLPKEKLPREGLPWIKNGDVLCITTDIPGLDVVHLGFALYRDGLLHLLHASSSGGRVLVSEGALADMFTRNKSWTGLRVLRVRPPREGQKGTEVSLPPSAKGL